jgi:hypothetical protein
LSRALKILGCPISICGSKKCSNFIIFRWNFFQHLIRVYSEHNPMVFLRIGHVFVSIYRLFQKKGVFQCCKLVLKCWYLVIEVDFWWNFRLYQSFSRRGIDCAHCRGMKMLAWPWLREYKIFESFSGYVHRGVPSSGRNQKQKMLHFSWIFRIYINYCKFR